MLEVTSPDTGGFLRNHMASGFERSFDWPRRMVSLQADEDQLGFECLQHLGGGLESGEVAGVPSQQSRGFFEGLTAGVGNGDPIDSFTVGQ